MKIKHKIPMLPFLILILFLPLYFLLMFSFSFVERTPIDLLGITNSFAANYKTGTETLLARAINGEARGESFNGQVAVGAVILNRTKDSRFPKTIAGVIYQPGAFTAVSDGQINTPLAANSTATKAARNAVNGWDPTNGCVYYWNPATATSKWIWSKKVLMKIGKHNFAK